MFSLSVAVLLSAAPVSVAVPGANCVGLGADLCESFLDRFVAVLTEKGTIRAVAQKDIAQVIGFERQRQLLGCTDEASRSCLAELAGALGVDGIVSISLTRSDPYFVATARIIRTRDGSQWVSATERVKQEGELFDAMDKIAGRFVTELVGSVSVPGKPVRILPWTPGIVGVVSAIAGTALFVSAGTERGQLVSGSLMTSEIRPIAESGRTKERLGVGLMIGGGVAIAASLVWVLLVPREEAPAISIAPIAGGASVVLGGTWP